MPGSTTLFCRTSGRGVHLARLRFEGAANYVIREIEHSAASVRHPGPWWMRRIIVIHPSIGRRRAPARIARCPPDRSVETARACRTAEGGSVSLPENFDTQRERRLQPRAGSIGASGRETGCNGIDEELKFDSISSSAPILFTDRDPCGAPMAGGSPAAPP